MDAVEKLRQEQKNPDKGISKQAAALIHPIGEMRFGGGDMSNIKMKEIVEVVVDNKGYTHGDKRRTQQVLAQRYKDLIGKTYRHFKGGLYEVIDIAVHSENAGLMVIYKSKKDPALVWARPLNMFLSDVDKDK